MHFQYEHTLVDSIQLTQQPVHCHHERIWRRRQRSGLQCLVSGPRNSAAPPPRTHCTHVLQNGGMAEWQVVTRNYIQYEWWLTAGWPCAVGKPVLVRTVEMKHTMCILISQSYILQIHNTNQTTSTFNCTSIQSIYWPNIPMSSHRTFTPYVKCAATEYIVYFCTFKQRKFLCHLRV